MIDVTSENNTSLKKLKTFSFKFFYLKPGQQWLELLTDRLFWNSKQNLSIDAGTKETYSLADFNKSMY